jgi:type IX secretion system PorP/SprF family membrane protein
MKKTIYSIILLLTCIITSSGFAQDTYFAQRNNSLNYINPSLTGALTNQSIHAGTNFYRFMSINEMSTYASFESPISKLNGAFGITHQLTNINSTFINQNLGASYAQRLKLSSNLTLSIGVKAELRNIYVDWSNLTFGDQIDPRYGFVYQTSQLPGNANTYRLRFAAGASLISKKWMLGYSAFNINRSKEIFSTRSYAWHQFHFTTFLMERDNSGLMLNLDYMHNKFNPLAGLSVVYYNRFWRMGTGVNEYEMYHIMAGALFAKWRLAYSLSRGVFTHQKNLNIHEIQFTYLLGKKANLNALPKLIWNNF